MKPEDPTDPHVWLLRARSNLNLAEKGSRLKGVFLEDLCFNAQQVAEKAKNIGRLLSLPPGWFSGQSL